jgi:hypothetical protein
MTRPLPSPRRHPPQLPLRSASRNPATQRNSGDGRLKESAGGGASSSRRGPPPRATRVSASVVSTCAEVTNLALAVTTATPRLVTAAGCGGAAAPPVDAGLRSDISDLQRRVTETEGMLGAIAAKLGVAPRAL